jgi:hypothetical protein
MPIGTRIREEHGDAVWTVAGIDANRQLVLLECHDVNTASAGIVPPVAPVVPVETRNDVEPLLTTCVNCGRTTGDPDAWDPEAGTGRVYCDKCWTIGG